MFVFDHFSEVAPSPIPTIPAKKPKVSNSVFVCLVVCLFCLFIFLFVCLFV